ncbi:MAG: hypothetical protein PHN89_00445 [Candidatus Pacebacteria bacterium]|nr:hypothetical protein [Candidatus Paceibacterota bacterium]
MTKKQAIQTIKHSLWVRGYRVKDVSSLGLGYDILVNERHKVRVMMPGEMSAGDKFYITVEIRKQSVLRPFWIRGDGTPTRKPEEVLGKPKVEE